MPCAEALKVLSFHPIISFLLHHQSSIYTPTFLARTHRRRLPPLSLSPKVVNRCRRIYTSHARPTLWHLYTCVWADRCTHSLNAQLCVQSHTLLKIGGENMQWSWKTTWRLNMLVMLCHDSYETPWKKSPLPPPFPPRGFCWGLIAWRFVTVKPDFLHKCQLTDITSKIRW